jgi:hypothetical protein
METEGIKVRGFFRLNLVEEIDGKEVIVGDSGRCENVITDLGFAHYLAALLGDYANSKQVTHVALGTGGAPATNDTSLDGELTHVAGSRDSVAAASNGSTAVEFTGAFASDVHNTTTIDISNIGLFQQSNTDTGTLFAGAEYASSSWATNQAVNYTYEITFA